MMGAAVDIAVIFRSKCRPSWSTKPAQGAWFAAMSDAAEPDKER
jgi:hypothetical protein